MAFDIGMRCRSADTPTAFSIPTRMGAPCSVACLRPVLHDHNGTTANRALSAGKNADIAVTAASLPGFFAHVSVFLADSAALPIRMSSVFTSIAGGITNSHCMATGALPGGDSSITENEPGFARSVSDGGTCNDWPHIIATGTISKIRQLKRRPIWLHDSNLPGATSVRPSNLNCTD